MFIDEKEGPNPNRFRITDHDFGTIIDIDQLQPQGMIKHARISDDKNELSI